MRPGDIVKILRARLGFSYEDVANAASAAGFTIEPRTISRIEKHHHVPRASTLPALAAGLNTTPEAICLPDLHDLRSKILRAATAGTLEHGFARRALEHIDPKALDLYFLHEALFSSDQIARILGVPVQQRVIERAVTETRREVARAMIRSVASGSPVAGTAAKVLCALLLSAGIAALAGWASTPAWDGTLDAPSDSVASNPPEPSPGPHQSRAGVPPLESEREELESPLEEVVESEKAFSEESPLLPVVEQAEVGYITVRFEAKRASLHVDGKPTTTDAPIVKAPIRAGRHSVTIVYPDGGASQTRHLIVQRGETTSYTFEAPAPDKTATPNRPAPRQTPKVKDAAAKPKKTIPLWDRSNTPAQGTAKERRRAREKRKAERKAYEKRQRERVRFFWEESVEEEARRSAEAKRQLSKAYKKLESTIFEECYDRDSLYTVEILISVDTTIPPDERTRSLEASDHVMQLPVWGCLSRHLLQVKGPTFMLGEYRHRFSAWLNLEEMPTKERYDFVVGASRHWAIVGQPAKSVAAVEKVIAWGGDGPAVQYILGHAYEKLGELEKSAEGYNGWLAKNCTSKLAPRIVKKIKSHGGTPVCGDDTSAPAGTQPTAPPSP